MDCLEEIKYLNRIMEIKTKKEMLKNPFSWLYPFTNENISGYYKELDFENKKVLTVTSSGDHALNALLKGSKTVESFDNNPLARFYSELKLNAIRALSLEEFILFFNRVIKNNKLYLSKNTYQEKIKKYLEDEYKVFWDYFFDNYDISKTKHNYLFNGDYLDIKGLKKSNYYLTDINYNHLKKILNEKKVKYYTLNLKDLEELKETYDLILLSNIPASIKDMYLKDNLKRLKTVLDKIKKDDSIIIFNYCYNNLMYGSNRESVYNLELINQIFNDNDVYRIWFESSDNLYMNKRLQKILYKEDNVIVLSNKKNI